MKQLLWKEWMEKRLIAFVCPGFLLLYIIGMMIGAKPPYSQRDFNDVESIALFACLLCGVLAGCDSFSSEIGNGTLSFLTSLPISRARVWWSKLLVGSLTIIISSVLILGIYELLAHIVGLNHHYSDHYPLFNDAETWLGVLTVTFYCFAVSLTVSPLVDRSLASAVISIGVSIGVACFFTTCASAIINQFAPQWPQSDYVSTFVTIAMIAAIFGAFLMASYRTVTRGGTLRTSHRFYLSGGVLVGWLMAGAAAFIAAVILVQRR